MHRLQGQRSCRALAAARSISFFLAAILCFGSIGCRDLPLIFSNDVFRQEGRINYVNDDYSVERCVRFAITKDQLRRATPQGRGADPTANLPPLAVAEIARRELVRYVEKPEELELQAVRYRRLLDGWVSFGEFGTTRTEQSPGTFETVESLAIPVLLNGEAIVGKTFTQRSHSVLLTEEEAAALPARPIDSFHVEGRVEGQIVGYDIPRTELDSCRNRLQGKDIAEQLSFSSAVELATAELGRYTDAPDSWRVEEVTLRLHRLECPRYVVELGGSSVDEYFRSEIDLSGAVLGRESLREPSKRERAAGPLRVQSD